LRGGPTSPPVAGIIKTGKQLAASDIETLLAIESHLAQIWAKSPDG